MPLNIFEPRYLSMVADAIKHRSPIALCQSHESYSSDQKSPLGRFEGKIAGMGTVYRLQKRADGTELILLEGDSKVRLGKIKKEDPYIICQAEILAEDKELEPQNLFRLNRVRNFLRQWAQDQDPELTEQLLSRKKLQDPATVMQMAAHFCLASAADRQKFLEIQDLNSGLDYLLDHIEEGLRQREQKKQRG